MENNTKTNGCKVISFKKFKKLNVLNREIIKDELNNSLINNYKTIILDLDGVNFIDSSVFRLLVEYERLSKIEGKKFYLNNVSQEVDELIHLLHLENKLIYRIAA